MRRASVLFLAVLMVMQSASSVLGDQQAGQEPPSLDLTLADSISLALKNNRNLLNIRLSRIVQKYALKVAEDKFWPDATVRPFTQFTILDGENRPDSRGGGLSPGLTLRVPTGGRFAVTYNNVVDDRDMTSYSTLLTLGFTQPLLKGGGVAVNTASVKTARLVEKINILALRAAVIGTISSVIQTYRNLIQANRRLDIAARSLQRSRDLLTVNQFLIQSGRMAELDIVQTQADVAIREISLVEAHNSLDAARLALIAILDIDSRTPIQATESLTINPVKPDVARSIEAALQNRPDYLQALLRIENAETELMLAKNNCLWDLSATFALNISDTGRSFRALGGTDSGDYHLGLDLRIPFGDLTLQQRYINADIALKQARNNLVELRQSVDIEVRNAVREVDVRLRQIDLAQRTRELAEQKFNVEKEKLNLGLSTNFQVSRFEDDLVSAQNGEVSTIITYLNALTRLDQTLGTTLGTWRINIQQIGG